MTAPRRGQPPRRVRWQYHFTDWRSGALLATLPLSGVRLSQVLGGPADAAATLTLTDRVMRRQPFRATIPRRSCMWAERQVIEVAGRVIRSDILWGGIVMSRQRKRAGRAVTLGLVTWESYLARRLVPFTRTYTQADKHTIARDLVAVAAEQVNVAALLAAPPAWTDPHLAPLTAAQPGSGVLADRTYLASDLKPVLEAVQQLAGSGSGFDWRLTPYRDTSGVFRVRLDLGTPRLGRVAPADVRWSDDDNDTRAGYLADYTLDENGAAVNNRVTALGEGTGPNQLRGVAVSNGTGGDTRAELLNGWPLFEASLGSSTQDLRTQQTVNEHARGALLAGQLSEVQLTGVKVRGDLAPDLTRYAVGDDGTFDLAASTTGEAVRIIGQIIGRTIAPAQRGGTEAVTLDVMGAVA